MGNRLASSVPTVRPILAVKDLEEAGGFYRRLGFTVDLFDASYALVGYGENELFHLATRSPMTPDQNRGGMYLHVSDVDEWHVRWGASGITATEVTDRPWGMREFSVTDPAGNTLRVGSNL